MINAWEPFWHRINPALKIETSFHWPKVGVRSRSRFSFYFPTHFPRQLSFVREREREKKSWEKRDRERACVWAKNSTCPGWEGCCRELFSPWPIKLSFRQHVGFWWVGWLSHPQQKPKKSTTTITKEVRVVQIYYFKLLYCWRYHQLLIYFFSVISGLLKTVCLFFFDFGLNWIKNGIFYCFAQNIAHLHIKFSSD